MWLAGLAAALFPLAAPAQAPQPAQPGPAAAPTAGQPLPREPLLDEIVVEAPLAVAESPEVQTIDRTQLEQRRGSSVVGALELEPAIHATVGRRGERIFTLRGFDQRQISVLLDGAPAYLPYDGLVNLALFPSALVEQITVVKGPASVVYGPNGLGGAVNIVTRRPGQGPLLQAEIERGQSGALILRGLESLRGKRWGATLYAGLQRQDAFPLSDDFQPGPEENGALRENSDRLLTYVGGSAGLELPAAQRLRGAITYLDGRYGIPPGVGLPAPRFWRATAWRGLAATLGHQGRLGRALVLDEQLYLRLYDNLLDGYDDASYRSQRSPRAFHSWFHDRVLGGRLRARYRLSGAPWGATALRLWAGVQHEQHREEGTAAPEAAPLDRLLISVIPEAEAFLGQRWSLLLALQLDLELPGDLPGGEGQPFVEPGPLLALRFDPLPGLVLRASAARRARLPTLKERFSRFFGARRPNPELAPETAWHLGLAASYRPLPWLAVEGSLADAEVEKLIELRPLAGEEQFVNVGRARLLSAELELRARPWRPLELSGGYALLHARRTDGPDQPLQYRPGHKATLGLAIRPLGWLELRSWLQLIGPQDFLHPASERWQRLEAQLRWSGVLSVRALPGLELWLRGANLLDSALVGEVGYPEPGRELWVGARLTFDPPRRTRRPALD